MQPLPHFYGVKANCEYASNLTISADNLSDICVAPPIGFDGPGDIWSPEDLFISSLASCTILSFRAVAKASHFDWISIECISKGELARIDGETRFTKIHTLINLLLPYGGDKTKANKLVSKADSTCLISNSLIAETTMSAEISCKSIGST